MSEMVERVARAIAEEINGGKFDDARWYNDDQRDVHRRRARAAIEAMREPTEAMLTAGDSAMIRKDDAAADAWQAMVDEALKSNVEMV